jgi:sterol-4alpha-carboxylate 3-dehydrogenase (decarboxylating)
MLDACAGSKPLVQVGNGKNMMEVMSADNCALGHVLVARALLEDPESRSEELRVDGEAFNISDGAPVPFWHHVRVIWGVARGTDALKSITTIPAWVMIVVVILVEWTLWLFTFDTVKPPTELRRTSLEYCIYSHTYNIDKARKRLGFSPVVDHDAVVARAAKLMLDQRAASQKTD